MAAQLVHRLFMRRTLPEDMPDRLMETEDRMRAAHAMHLGCPCNLSFGPGLPAALQRFLINNLGDPYAASHHASEVCEMEREAVA